MEETEKTYVKIEVIKGERKYYFYIENNSPIGEAYDAAHEVLVKLLEYAQEATTKMKPEEPVVEVIKKEN